MYMNKLMSICIQNCVLYMRCNNILLCSVCLYIYIYIQTYICNIYSHVSQAGVHLWVCGCIVALTNQPLIYFKVS